MQECALAAKALGIDRIGGSYDGKVIKDVVYRSSSVLSKPMNFPYLSVSDKVDSLQSADLITISSFRKAKASLKKKLRVGLGIEFLLHPARKMNAEGLSKWFAELREAHIFCKSSGCQFILSSGAKLPIEMISGRCFDEILIEVGIDYHKHWRDMDKWLSSILAKKVIVK